MFEMALFKHQHSYGYAVTTLEDPNAAATVLPGTFRKSHTTKHRAACDALHCQMMRLSSTGPQLSPA
jgi:hypothetical protein